MTVAGANDHISKDPAENQALRCLDCFDRSNRFSIHFTKGTIIENGRNHKINGQDESKPTIQKKKKTKKKESKPYLKGIESSAKLNQNSRATRTNQNNVFRSMWASQSTRPTGKEGGPTTP